MRVDAHVHGVDVGPNDSSRVVTIDVLTEKLDRESVEGAVLVQADGPTAVDTSTLLAMSRHDSRIFGVVGTVDLGSGVVDRTIRELQEMAGGEKLVGLRQSASGEQSEGWLVRDEILMGLQTIADAGLVIELDGSEPLVTVAQAISLVQGGRWVLGGAGCPAISTGEMDPWRMNIHRIARQRNVACKLTGLVGPTAEAWMLEERARYVRHIVRAFGAQRVISGSNWPNCLPWMSYRGATDAQDQLVAELPGYERQAILGGNALEWYRLSHRPADQPRGKSRKPAGRGTAGFHSPVRTRTVTPT